MDKENCECPDQKVQDSSTTRKRATKRRREPDCNIQDNVQIPKSSVTDGENCSQSVEGGTNVEAGNRSHGEITRRFTPHDKESRPKRRRRAEVGETVQTSVPFKDPTLMAEYLQLDQLGEGGCGSVFAGFRKKDYLPVAIKHIPKKNLLKQVRLNGQMLPAEVAVMLKLAAEKDGSMAASSPVDLIDWYDLGHELILVMERPLAAINLWKYIVANEVLDQDEAKNIMKQLVDAAIGLEERQIFHRDIKLENILIEMCPTVPRVRLIDFGLSCIVEQGSVYRRFRGTEKHIPPEFWGSSTYMPGPTTVWQLGIVLFEMLHSKEDFKTSDFLKNKLKIKKDLPESCKHFLRWCLRKDPETRPNLAELRDHQWLT